MFGKAIGWRMGFDRLSLSGVWEPKQHPLVLSLSKHTREL